MINEKSIKESLEKSVTEYLNDEYAAYGMYTIENRAIPSVIDGFKPTQRKIIHIANKVWKSGSEKPIKVFQLGGRIASDAHYHHGDCLDPDTEIMLTDGSYITIGEWFEKYPEKEMKVLAYDEGNKKFVEAIGHSPRVGNITTEEYELEMEDGSIFKCTGNHPFLTQRGWIEAKDIRETDDIINF